MTIQLPKEFRPVQLFSAPNKPSWVFKSSYGNIHYTAFVDIDKRKFNIHKTFETNKKHLKKDHRDVLTIRFFTIGRLICLLEKSILSLLKQYYHRIPDDQFIYDNFDSLLPLDCNQDMCSEIMVNKKNTIRLAKEIKIEGIEKLLLDPKDFRNCQSQTFSAISEIEGEMFIQGTIFKSPLVNDESSVLFISADNQLAFNQAYLNEFFKALNSIKFKGRGKILKILEKCLENITKEHIEQVDSQ